MRKTNQVLNRFRVRNIDDATDGMAGMFIIHFSPVGAPLRIISSGHIDCGGWEHVSVSCPRRTPTWAEMCFIKDFFWDDNETVIQFHPKKSSHINIHPYCLHMWKKQNGMIDLPPSVFV